MNAAVSYLYSLPAHYAAVWLIGVRLVCVDFANRPAYDSWAAMMDKTYCIWRRLDE